MTDKDIINGLIARDNHVTEEFFFVKCRPLFCSIIQKIFDYEVDYNECVNELYVYLMVDDAIKLRKFEYRSTVYQWLKVLAIRFFINKRGRMIDDRSQETPYDEGIHDINEVKDVTAKGDIERLFCNMPNKRYVYVCYTSPCHRRFGSGTIGTGNAYYDRKLVQYKTPCDGSTNTCSN